MKTETKQDKYIHKKLLMKPKIYKLLIDEYKKLGKIGRAIVLIIFSIIIILVFR